MNLSPLQQAHDARRIRFERVRWERTLSRCTVEEQAAALELLGPDATLTPASVNAALRAVREQRQAVADRAASDRARAVARAEWDRFMGRAS